jgi:hypothetical protein
MRTDGSKGTYEWWYFDAELDDGSKLVITFFTKPFSDLDKGLTPQVTLEIDRPDGTSIQKLFNASPEDFSASRDQCDVQIGSNFFRGNLHTYAIHTDVEGIQVDLQLTGEVPPWRPESGFWLYGDKEEHYFAWLPSVPQGRVHATLVLDGEP